MGYEYDSLTYQEEPAYCVAYNMVDTSFSTDVSYTPSSPQEIEEYAKDESNTDLSIQDIPLVAQDESEYYVAYSEISSEKPQINNSYNEPITTSQKASVKYGDIKPNIDDSSFDDECSDKVCQKDNMDNRYSLSAEYLSVIHSMQNDFNKESEHKSVAGGYKIGIEYDIDDTISIFSRYFSTKSNKVNYDVEATIAGYNFEASYDNYERIDSITAGIKMNIFRNDNVKINIYGELGRGRSRFTSIYHETTNYPHPTQYPATLRLKKIGFVRSGGIEFVNNLFSNIEGFITLSVYENGIKNYTIRGKNTPMSGLVNEKSDIGIRYMAGTGLKYRF